MKTLVTATLLLLLAGCASNGGHSEMYGEIKAGVETSVSK